MNTWLDGTALQAIPGAVLGGLVAGALLPLLGLWVVLQRVVFLGVTLAQIAAAGVSLALVLQLPALPVGLGLTLLVVACGSLLRTGGVARLGDATLGSAFCAASALSLLFISRSSADMDEVQHVLHGNLIYASPDAVALVAATLLGGIALLFSFFKELLFSAFDPLTATALGLSARRWLLLLFVVLACGLSVSMQTTGSLLSFAMLVLPPLAALQLKRGLAATFALASGLGLLGTFAGLLFAVAADLHLESSITLTLFLLIPICSAWRTRPALGLATLALTVWAGWAWAGSTALDEEVHRHHHEQGVGSESLDDPFHVDVHLEASRSAAQGTLSVQWTADVHRGVPISDEQLPPALWLVLTGDELFHAHSLIPETGELPGGDSRHGGSFVLDLPAPVHRLEGQLWSGPVEAMDAQPLDPLHAVVDGCDVRPVD